MTTPTTSPAPAVGDTIEITEGRQACLTGVVQHVLVDAYGQAWVSWQMQRANGRFDGTTWTHRSEQMKVTARRQPMTATRARRLARQARRYGYFQEQGAALSVTCPLHHDRVQAYRAPGHTVVQALDAAMVAHLTNGECPAAPTG